MRTSCFTVLRPRLGGIVLAVALLTGCGRVGFSSTSNQTEPDAAIDAETFGPPPAAFVNGTRLRAIRQQVGDVDRLVGWHDMLLDLDCDFMDTPMGQRCMPYAIGTTNLNADPQCTVPLASTHQFRLTGCGTTPGYIYNNQTKTAHVITPHLGPTYILTAGSCVVRDAPELALFDIGPAVDVTRFVGSHEEQTAGREFSYLETVADDGARVRESTVVNNATGKKCAWLDTNVDERRCIDDATVGVLAYADAACSDEVVLVNQQVSNVVVKQPTLCDDHPRVLTLGAAFTGPLFQRDVNGTCVTMTTTLLAFRPGQDHIADYPVASPTVGPGTSRVRPLVWRTTSGEDFEDYFFWDTAVDAKCTPFVDAASKRQICGSVWTSNFFPIYTDATCGSTPRYVVSDCRERGGATWYPTAPFSGTCDGLAFQVITYGTAGAPTAAYERRANGACEAIDVVTHPLRVPAGTFNFDASSAMPVTTVR